MELNKIYLGDCIKIMQDLPNNSVDLVFADPPFNIGLKYDIYINEIIFEVKIEKNRHRKNVYG